MLTKAPHLFDDATRVTAGDSRWQGHTSEDYWAFVGPFGGITAAVQPPNPGGDLSAALEQWVEKGVAPETIRAVKPKNLLLALYDPSQGGVDRSALLCAFPQRAKFKGGDQNDAASYVCAAP